jgi:hypothetical protein
MLGAYSTTFLIYTYIQYMHVGDLQHYIPNIYIYIYIYIYPLKSLVTIQTLTLE